MEKQQFSGLWMEPPSPIVQESDMADNPYSPAAVGRRLELARKALGYKKKTDFIKTVPGLDTAKWYNYTGSKSKPARDMIPPKLVAAIRRAHPDVSMEWVYTGSMDTVVGRMREALELAAQDAPPSRSKGRRKPQQP